jgi:hypothetical protein
MKISLLLSLVLLSTVNAISQNIGINNTNPQAALDLNGDLRLRSATLTLPTGLSNDVDLTTVKSSVYMFAGGALALGGCQITGFTGGVDGRVVTIFNNSTNGAIQLYDANFSISPSLPANKIITGTGSSAVIYGNGSVTLRYDGAKQKWTIISSHYTDGLSTLPVSPWGISGNNIYNSNTAKVGIGNTNPQAKLDITGNIKIADGTQGAGKVLTSDANGAASWQTNATANSSSGAAGYGSWGDCATNANISEYNPVLPDDAVNSDSVGHAVALSGDFAAISNGINCVYIYKYNATTGIWDFHQKISGFALDHFGCSVAMYNDYLVVGAEREDMNNGAYRSGSASIYKNIAGVWTFQTKLSNTSNANFDDYFGHSVSVNGDYAIIGAHLEDPYGSVSVYKNAAGIWTFQTKLVVPLLQITSVGGFGKSISLHGDYAIIGSPGERTLSGAVFMFKNIAGVWTFQQKIPNPTDAGGEVFGIGVSMYGDYAIVGARDAFAQIGVPLAVRSGSASIFKNIAGLWTFQTKLLNIPFAENDYFGNSVAITGDYAIVGAYGDDVAGVDQGSATIYKRLGNAWQKYQFVVDPAGITSDGFGSAIRLDATTKRFLIGAPGSYAKKGKAIFGKIN